MLGLFSKYFITIKHLTRPKSGIYNNDVTSQRYDRLRDRSRMHKLQTDVDAHPST